MTKEQLASLDFEARANYFEREYPYVFPENEVIEIVDVALTNTLSPMENAYFQWMLELNDSAMAVNKFIHPAYYFDKESFGVKYFKNKDFLTELIRKMRRECPYLRLYTSDYLAGVLHQEVQYLRSRERKHRFYGPDADPTKFLGKKSPHDQEMEEIDRLLACLKQIHELKMAVGGFTNGGDSTDPQSRHLDNSVDRVIARTKELIHKRETATG